jgi:dethiobiotin synthetase
MKKPIFITGIGTGVGKTLVSAIVAEALGADYWKPVQAGLVPGTDPAWVSARLSAGSRVFEPAYLLKQAVSPHIAAREEGVTISLSYLREVYDHLISGDPGYLVIEGVGGLLVPLNQQETILDLIRALDAGTIIVSRNYLGSINHSLLTARALTLSHIRVYGWIFNDQYLQYEDEIADWTGYPKIASIPFLEDTGADIIRKLARRLKPALDQCL